MVVIASVDRLALVQPRVGIGDMIWHLPHIRALAQAMGRHVTLITRPRSLAGQLVGADDGIADIFWLERDQWAASGRHQGNAGFARLVADLRVRRFDAAVFLTRSRNLALAAALAGIPRRYGYGMGLQRLLLRGPRLPRGVHSGHPFEQAGAWLAAVGVPCPEPHPRLLIQPAARAAVRAQPGLLPGRFGVLGIAGSDAWKKWPVPSFARLATSLLAQGWPALVLVGGPAEQPDAEAIRACLDPASAARVIPVLGRDLREVAALLHDAAFYVGNDTAALNIAAAVGTRAYGLFGATPVLRHSPNIIPIVPSGSSSHGDGMARISVDAVLNAITDDRICIAPAA